MGELTVGRLDKLQQVRALLDEVLRDAEDAARQWPETDATAPEIPLWIDGLWSLGEALAELERIWVQQPDDAEARDRWLATWGNAVQVATTRWNAVKEIWWRYS